MHTIQKYFLSLVLLLGVLGGGCTPGGGMEERAGGAEARPEEKCIGVGLPGLFLDQNSYKELEQKIKEKCKDNITEFRFLDINTMQSFEEQGKQAIQKVKEILDENPGKKIIVFAHSNGYSAGLEVVLEYFTFVKKMVCLNPNIKGCNARSIPEYAVKKGIIPAEFVQLAAAIALQFPVIKNSLPKSEALEDKKKKLSELIEKEKREGRLIEKKVIVNPSDGVISEENQLGEGMDVVYVECPAHETAHEDAENIQKIIEIINGQEKGAPRPQAASKAQAYTAEDDLD